MRKERPLAQTRYHKVKFFSEYISALLFDYSLTCRTPRFRTAESCEKYQQDKTSTRGEPGEERAEETRGVDLNYIMIRSILCVFYMICRSLLQR